MYDIRNHHKKVNSFIVFIVSDPPILQIHPKEPPLVYTCTKNSSTVVTLNRQLHSKLDRKKKVLKRT